MGVKPHQFNSPITGKPKKSHGLRHERFEEFDEDIAERQLERSQAMREQESALSAAYETDQISAKKREIARLDLLGCSHEEIAEQVGLARKTVGFYLNQPVVMQQTRNLQRARDEKFIEIESSLLELRQKAVDNIEHVLDKKEDATGRPPSEKLVTDTSFKLLDRTGHGPVAKSESQSLNLSGSIDDVSKVLRQRLLDVRAELDDAEEVEFEEVEEAPKDPEPSVPLNTLTGSEEESPTIL